MKKLKNLLILVTLVATSAAASAASHAGSPMAPLTDLTQGEIRKVDVDNKKITIKHGEIKNLDMPPMTMVFQVKDDALLGKAKAGDKVRFSAEKLGGAYAVTNIQPGE